MNFHSIVHRELLLSSKRRSSYLARSGIAGSAGLAAIVIVEMTVKGMVAPSDAGRTLLWALASMGMVLVLAEGVLLTLDAIARERREGTLGLLFLSNLNGYDVVIGKGVGAGLRTLFALLAASPAPALTFLFGGVTPGDYAKVVLTLLNALFFALSLGLFISCLGENRRQNGAIGIGLLLWFMIGAPAMGVFLAGHKAFLAATLVGASPAAPLFALLDPTIAPRGMFAGSLAMSDLLAWVLLFLAGFFLNRNWRLPAPVSVPRANVTNFNSGIRPNPILRLLQRRGPSLKAFWMSSAFVGLASVAVLIFVPVGLRLPVYSYLVLLLHFILSFNLAAAASRALAQDQDSGILEILLTTPIDEQSIVSGHLLALKRQTGAALAFLVSLGIFLIVLWSFEIASAQLMLAALAYGAGLLLHVFELTLSARLGLWKGLKAGHKSNAFRRTFATVGLTLVLVALFAGLVIVTFAPTLQNETLMFVGFGAGAIAFTAVTAGMVATAIARLGDGLRSAAALPDFYPSK